MNPLIVLLSTVVVATAAVASTAEPVVKLSFRDTIKPVLREKCAHCHNRKTLPDKVSFESKKLAFTKTKAGQPIIVPGKPDESLMVLAIESPVFHEKAMPLVGPRPNVDEIALIRRWIAEGAEWPDGPVGRIKPLFHPKE
jgi:mono/diheme cytochrome c family protein